MKKIVIILIVLLMSFSAMAQYNPYKVDHKDAIVALSLITTTIVLDAMGDSFNDTGRKTIGHSLNALSIGSLLLAPVLLDLTTENWILYGITYIGLRISFFDPVYNLTRGLPIGFIGSTSAWDRTIKQMTGPGQSWLLGIRSLSLVVAISIPIKYY